MTSRVDTLLKTDGAIKICEFDTAAKGQRFLIQTSSGKRLDVSRSVVTLLSLLDGQRASDEIAEEFSKLTGKKYSAEDVVAIAREYLVPHGLLTSTQVTSQENRSRYLRFQIPLFSQQALLPITTGLKPLFNRWILLILLGLVGLFHLCFYFVFSKPSFDLSLLTVSDIAILYSLIFCSSLFHEIGHSTACSAFGAQHGKIGIGLYWYFFVFYADVSDAWRLPRRERVLVDFGGIYFQLLLLPLIFSIFLMTRSYSLLYYIYLMDLQILVNLNPILRFDGYWLVADLLGIPNFRKRTQELTSYWIRRVIGKRHPYPSMLQQVNRRSLSCVYIYTLLANLFFLYFFYRMALLIPEAFAGFPSKCITFIRGLALGFQTRSFHDALHAFSNLVVPFFVLLMITSFIYQIIRPRFLARERRRSIDSQYERTNREDGKGVEA